LTAHLSREVNRGELQPVERERYVRWWIERSGLSERQLRTIATAIWADDDVHLGPQRGNGVMRRR
jgi:hypothetical protein